MPSEQQGRRQSIQPSPGEPLPRGASRNSERAEAAAAAAAAARMALETANPAGCFGDMPLADVKRVRSSPAPQNQQNAEVAVLQTCCVDEAAPPISSSESEAMGKGSEAQGFSNGQACPAAVGPTSTGIVEEALRVDGSEGLKATSALDLSTGATTASASREDASADVNRHHENEALGRSAAAAVTTAANIPPLPPTPIVAVLPPRARKVVGRDERESAAVAAVDVLGRDHPAGHVGPSVAERREDSTVGSLCDVRVRSNSSVDEGSTERADEQAGEQGGRPNDERERRASTSVGAAIPAGRASAADPRMLLHPRDDAGKGRHGHGGDDGVIGDGMNSDELSAPPRMFPQSSILNMMRSRAFSSPRAPFAAGRATAAAGISGIAVKLSAKPAVGGDEFRGVGDDTDRDARTNEPGTPPATFPARQTDVKPA